MAIAIGAFLNAMGILAGTLLGLLRRQPVSARAQDFFRRALGAFTVFFGLLLIGSSVHGTFFSGLKQIVIVLLAVVFGNGIGKILRLQKISNRLGRFAGRLMANAQKSPAGKSADGFGACAILFCAAPLGIVGAVTDGLSGYFYFLAVKAVMDALAMMGFLKIFGWFSALSAFPVFIFLGSISFACRFSAKPFLDLHNLTDSVNAAAGLIGLAVALVIFGTRKVELANLLPALALAPLLAHFL